MFSLLVFHRLRLKAIDLKVNWFFHHLSEKNAAGIPLVCRPASSFSSEEKLTGNRFVGGTGWFCIAHGLDAIIYIFLAKTRKRKMACSSDVLVAQH